MKKVCITGADGFIGSNLVKKYLESGYYVVGIGLNDENIILENKNYKFYKIEFDNYDKIPVILFEKDFESFIHLAWYGYGKLTNEYNAQIINIKASCDAITAAVQLKCKKFIFAGSSHEFQKNYYNNDLNNEPELCSIYGAAKNSAKRFCKVIAHNNGLLFNSVIFTNVYGIGDYSNRSTNTFVKKLLNHDNLSLIEGSHYYDWTYIDDVVNGVFMVDTQGKNKKDYYIGSNTLKTFKEIIIEVRDIISPNSKLNFGAYNDSAFIDYSNIDVSELYGDTGYVPKVTIQDGIIKLINWMEELNR